MSSEMPDFGFAPNTYNLINGSPSAYTIRWGGLQFTVPARDSMGSHPAKDATGAPIPGSCTVSDSWTFDRDGNLPEKGSPPNWLAFEAIRNVLGVDPATKLLTGTAAQAGIQFLPNNATSDQIERAQEEGLRRWTESRYEWAEHQIAAYNERVGKAREANAPLPPPDRSYREAVAILEKRDQQIQAEIGNTQSLQAPVAEEESDAEAELEMMVLAKAKALELAKKQTPNIEDQEKLAAELVKDENFLNLMRKQGLRIRKVGHLDPPSPE